jgi:hypothetical protein
MIHTKYAVEKMTVHAELKQKRISLLASMSEEKMMHLNAIRRTGSVDEDEARFRSHSQCKSRKR